MVFEKVCTGRCINPVPDRIEKEEQRHVSYDREYEADEECEALKVLIVCQIFLGRAFLQLGVAEVARVDEKGINCYYSHVFKF